MEFLSIDDTAILWIAAAVVAIVASVVFVVKEYVIYTDRSVAQLENHLRRGDKDIEGEYTQLVQEAEQVLRQTRENRQVVDGVARDVLELQKRTDEMVRELDVMLSGDREQLSRTNFADLSHQIQQGLDAADAVAQRVRSLHADARVRTELQQKAEALRAEMQGIQIMIDAINNGMSKLEAVGNTAALRQGLENGPNIKDMAGQLDTAAKAFDTQLAALRQLLQQRQVSSSMVAQVLRSELQSVCIEDVCVSAEQLNNFLRSTVSA